MWMEPPGGHQGETLSYKRGHFHINHAHPDFWPITRSFSDTRWEKSGCYLLVGCGPQTRDSITPSTGWRRALRPLKGFNLFSVSKLSFVSFQPERIDPSASRQGYDVRSDVWSLGITLVSLKPVAKWNQPAAWKVTRVCRTWSCLSVRTRHRTVPVSEVEQRVWSADSGGARWPAAAQQLGGEALLPQIYLLCQRVVRNFLKHYSSAGYI